MSDLLAVAFISATAPTLTVALSWWQQRKKLEQALALIVELKAEIVLLKAEVAELRGEF